MSTFNLTIKLGNAEMQSEYDIAASLRELAERLENESVFQNAAISDSFKPGIYDVNGNRVGYWEVSK